MLKHPNQLNHIMLVNAIEFMGNNDKFNRKKFKAYLEENDLINSSQFGTNFRHMSLILPNNHAKVFNKLEDDYYELWAPVKDYILSEYKKIQD